MKKVSEQLKILTEGEAEILPVNSLKEKLIILIQKKTLKKISRY